jgi:uncharacterized repeat protein (TIGR01451 family)
MKRTSGALLSLLLLFAVGGVAAQDPEAAGAARPDPDSPRPPTELQLKKAGSTTMDLRLLRQTTPLRKRERPERGEPKVDRVELPGGPAVSAPVQPGPGAPAPPPIATFAGLDFATWGAGHPPDTNGDVGPTHYIQTINTSIGIYRKSDGFLLTAFTFDTFMSLGAFGNLCDTENFGDPVVLYDSFEDRWIITDFAFTLDGSGNIINPPGVFQCFAASKTGDPVSGGWNFYSINTAGGIGDYPKFGIWPDGLYMTANMFGYAAGAPFQNTRVFALNKAQMYAGTPTVQVVTFNVPSTDFTILPSNARLQTGTPPPGTPNYFVSSWLFLNALTVYKFHVDWDRLSLSTFTGPDTPLAATSWPNAAVPNAPSLGGNNLDVLQIRAMMQNQYTNIGGVESLWNTHTVRRADTTGFAAPRWYQVNVTGGTVAANIPQAATWDPDAANIMHRFMPSLAVDRAGDMALGYSTSSSTTKPAVKYAGRLASDPVNTLGQTEQLLIQGAGTQTGSCGGGACARWGDYSAMTLDPDGCTFWYTNMYYAVDGLNHQTQVGSFAFPSCTPVGAGGTLSGTVTATVGGAPISGATVAFGSRTTTTDLAGFYSFLAIPAGTYASITASAPGYISSTATSIVVTDGGTTTQDFSLATAPASACLTDTTQADFQTGTLTNVDLNTSPGDVILLNAPFIDQQNTAGTTTGTGFGTPNWTGQTFIAGVTGTLVKVEVPLFCANGANPCTGPSGNLTLSVRNTAAGLPTGADLATATIPSFTSNAGATFTVTFGVPPSLTSGTQYALILRPVSNPAVGSYFWIRSSPSTYANGSRVTSVDSGGTWATDTTRDYNFKAYMQAGFPASGTLVSSIKDSNPAPGFAPTWTTLSWTASTPANTAVQFQVAASNSAFGPFNFVGPDGTALTFFTTSGASLSQFDGNRYLEYKAYLSTTDNTVTPTLNDVTVCFTDLGPPDLAITKSDLGASVAPGGTVAYVLTYGNVAGQGATGVVLSETVPANTVFNPGASTAGWLCVPNNNAGSTCALAVGTLATGGGGTATFAATVVDPVAAGVTQIFNTASIADDGTHGADPTPGNNSGSDSTPVIGAPDLSMVKSDGGASVAPGGTVGYTLTYANSGNRGATGVVLSETVPANTTFNPGASTAGWVCVPNNNAGSTCTLAVGGLAAGSGNQAATFAVTVVNPVAAGVSQISNTASIADDGTNGADPTPGNNSGSDTTPVTGAPDLSITKSDGGASVAPGGTVAYTLTYANAGNRGASGVVLTETVPANTTFNAGASTAGWVCVPNNAAGSTCTLVIGGLVAGGGNQTATFAVTVGAPLPSGVVQIANTASIADDGANGTDPTPGNNTGSDTTPVTGAPDLSITKSDGGASVVPGGTVVYTLTYANAGNRGASGVVLTETVPANTTFNSGASTAGWVCVPNNAAGSTCTLAVGGLVAGGGDQTATFAVTVGTPLPSGVVQISNTASITDDGANGTDPTPGNNTGSDTTPVTAAPDLSITKSDGGVLATPGGTVAYVLTYANSGAIGATGVVITETVPIHATFEPGGSTAGWACTPDNSAGSTCLLSVGSLAGASGSQTATFAVTVDNPLPGGVTEIANTASIADDGAGGPDPTPADNSGSDVTPVQVGLYYTLVPCRLVDTRYPVGPYGGPALAALSMRTFIAVGQCAVPAGATALSFIITVNQPTAGGDLRVYGAGVNPALTSVINYAAGQTRANNGVVTLGAGGDFVVQSDQPTGTVHVIIDLMGYFR